MDSAEIAALLTEAALLMELEGENAFKVRSFRKAADVIAESDVDLDTLAAEGKLQTLPGIGKGIAAEITGYREQGQLPVLEALKERVPPGLPEMTRIRGLGPAKIRTIHQTLGIATLGELEYACLENRLAALKGFGARTQEKVLKELKRLKAAAGRFHIHYALAALREFEDFALGLPGVVEASVAGEPRRHCETVTEGCLIVCSEEAPAALQAVLQFEGILEVVEQGPIRARVVLAGGLPVEVFASPPDLFGSNLLAGTGSEDHLADLERHAADKGIMFEEGRLQTRDAMIPASSEEEIYAALDLPFIAPEMREGRGEVAAAAAGEIPALIERGDLKGVLHVHTDWSDGAETLETMAEAAREKGFDYLGIADHSRSAGYAGGLSAEKLAEQGAAIATLNNKWKDFRILHGVESDILTDGSLDYERKDLKRLDFVVASVHGAFSQDRETMTRRIIAAMEDPMTRVLAHPTGRLLLGRDPYEVDMDAVLEAAARLGVMIEINANPYRLDLDWRHLARCRELGIRILINPDAHGIDGLDDVDYGIGIARKGGLDKEMVANCLPAEELTALWKRE